MNGRIGGFTIAMVIGAVGALHLGSPHDAAAQLSSVTHSTSGSACNRSSDSDGYCGSSVGFSSGPTGTSFTSRYAWNVNADVGIFSTRDMSGTASHHVNFNATAPGSYRLNISTSRVGDLNRRNDASGCNGRADISGVTGSTNIGLASGSLGLSDPGSIGNGGSTTHVNISQGSAAVIGPRLSNGVAQAHALTFTWTGSVRSNSCEAAVRVGQQNGSTTGCSACGYSGSPSRTQSSDGHFVTVTFTSFCGNGTVDGTGEQCDAGAANGTAGSCCSSSCTFKSNGTACTDDGNGCTNDTCNGVSATCQHPNNSAACSDGLFCNGTDTCGGGSCSVHAGNPCPGADGDANCSESCNETTDSCTAADPNGSACSDGVFCNGADTCNAGACSTHTGDPCLGPDGDGNCSESCNEGADDCTAADPNGSACTDGLFCDGTDTCSGGTCSAHAGDPCPGPDGDGNCSESCNEAADACTAPDPNGTACTDGLFCTGSDTCGGGACSVHTGDPCVGPDGDGNCSESCNEGADDCTAPDPDGTACTDGLFCNGTDTCGGGTCATHGGDPCVGGTECNDLCNEAADDCADPGGTACTDDTNPCTTDTCDGAGTCAHPAGNAGAPCRPLAGDCDVAESCDGVSPSCPTDGFKPSSVECRASAGFCDVAESCTGSAATCPTDGFKPSSVECRADTGQCDVAESCTGSAADCPTDGFEPAGTPCDDGDNCTTDDQCDGANACSLTVDVNSLCLPCEACDPADGSCVPGPRPSCLQPTVSARARLLIKDNPDRDAADLVVWKWIKGQETTLADFGDPTTTDDYTLCVFDAGDPILNASVPAGGTCGSLPCWRPLGASGFKYINRDRTPDGMLKVLLRSGADGKAKIIVKGKGENLPFPASFLPLHTPVSVQLQSASGTCWETNHVSTGPLLNTTEQFKAVDEGPLP